ncbi:GTP 3',8-cyclase MoaA [uncultured Maribacter sp.]|uniref:GTP 3',8-cyclase MoaA n=1 Tax=uncultured Maribacter sp. TaxID=431308 RepID=UPI00262444C5|nr:GTP 3',8-cyclase MoaA [uncultured Maribacter sp.]
MGPKTNTLTDTFGRAHSYLRISLTERCNLRCTYCMPAAGVPLSPKAHLMTADEVYAIAKTFVDHGVTKIRLTGGEPLVRKDFREILQKLASLPVRMGITTNGITVDRFIADFKKNNLKDINVSLDSLDVQKFKDITRRDYFERVYNNILLLEKEGFNVKVNVVLIKDFNDSEIVDFIGLTKDLNISVRFIEFMPFDGNKWNVKKMVSYAEIMKLVNTAYTSEKLLRLQDAPNDTTKNYSIKGFKGSFGIISSVSNPFCDSCNRLRLTANGCLKNCLFSSSESNLLGLFREGKSIIPSIAKAVKAKQKIRGEMDTLEKLKESNLHSKNRSMITIGG